MKILIITTNFGFGPSSKLYSITLELLKQGYEDITFCGNKESLKFFKRNLGNKLNYIDCPTDTIDYEDFIKTVNIETYDVLINVMNINIPEILCKNKIKIKKVYVDSLSWMWNEEFNGIDKYDIYFAQNVFMDQSKLSKYKNAQIINPIINTEGYSKVRNLKKNKILINFAGIMTPYKNDIFYKKYINFYIKLFQRILNTKKYEVICACNTEQLAWIQRNNNFNCDISFKVMTHKEFLSEACESSKIFTTPGLTFYLESLELGLKPYYLLPSNYSQALLLEKYSQSSIDCVSLHDYGYNLSMNELLDEDKGVSMVRRIFSEITTNRSEKVEKTMKSYLIQNNDSSSYKTKVKEKGEKTIIRIMTEQGILRRK